MADSSDFLYKTFSTERFFIGRKTFTLVRHCQSRGSLSNFMSRQLKMLNMSGSLIITCKDQSRSHLYLFTNLAKAPEDCLLLPLDCSYSRDANLQCLPRLFNRTEVWLLHTYTTPALHCLRGSLRTHGRAQCSEAIEAPHFGVSQQTSIALDGLGAATRT